MFNFNNVKRREEPSFNTAANGGQGSEKNDTKKDGNAFVDERVDEIERQRIEFMKKNPDFDMKAEMDNPDFVNYVWKMGLSVEDAFFLAHRDEIIQQAINDALGKITAKKNRIAENGAGKNSPAVVRKNPKDMSDKEIDSIIDRVRNGEKISF